MQDELHILMTTDTVGGVWTYSITLCKSLQTYGVKVHLAAMGGFASQSQRQEVDALKENVTFYDSNYKLEWMENPWEDVDQAQHWLHSIYLQVQPDLIHLNNFAKIHPDWKCPIITVYHSCVATWWRSVHKEPIPQAWNLYLNLLQNTLKASDRVVAPSKELLLQATTILDIDSPGMVIYNAREDRPSSEVKKENFILATGRVWDEAKNLQLLEACAKEISWPVYVAGNSTNPASGAEVRLQNVKMLGQLTSEELNAWMQRAAIFCSPAKYEPFGLAILEAAKAGCALVLSNLRTLKELWDDAAVYFNPNEKDELWYQIQQLIDNREYLEVQAFKAKQRSQTYTASKMAREYMRLYTYLLRNFKKKLKQKSV